MLVRRIARPLLAAIFVTGGLDALRHPQDRKQSADPVVKTVAAPLGLPQDTELLVRATGVTMFVGGLLLATGRFPRVASTVLAGALVPVTATHDFWAQQDPQAKAMHRIQFTKNLGLLGGLLLAAVDTAGKPGLAYRAKLAGDSVERSVKQTRREARRTAREAGRTAKLAGTSVEHSAKQSRRQARRLAKQTTKHTVKDARRTARAARREAQLATLRAKNAV